MKHQRHKEHSSVPQLIAIVIVLGLLWVVWSAANNTRNAAATPSLPSIAALFDTPTKTPVDALDEVERMEARVWLRISDGKAVMAPGRFANAAAIQIFVEGLYTAGARKVEIANSQPGSAADAMIVTLPTDPIVRARVLSVTNAEASQAGLPVETDAGQPLVVLVWQ